MIVCSCNLLTDGDVKACLGPGPDCPRTPAQVYRCLGCSPNCGSCARTIRSIMTDALAGARAEACNSCSGCPAHDHGHEHDHAVDHPAHDHAPPMPVLAA